MPKSSADVAFEGLIKKVTHTLKEDKDPETKEVIGYHTETAVTFQATELDDETARLLAALQGTGEIVIEVSRRQGALFKNPSDGPSSKEAH